MRRPKREQNKTEDRTEDVLHEHSYLVVKYNNVRQLVIVNDPKWTSDGLGVEASVCSTDIWPVHIQ